MYIKIRDKLKKHSEYYQPGCEVDIECYRDKIIRKLKKKRWKKYKKFVLERRRARIIQSVWLLL
jgi:hypothetical protein